MSGPRIPCANFAAWMGEKGWVRRFAERGRSGAYLSVVTEGTISVGEAVEVVARPGHDITVPVVLDAFFGDLDAARRVLDAEVLGEADHAALARATARRRS